MDSSTPVHPSPAKLIAGVILIALGVLYTLNAAGLAVMPNIGRLWPLVLVAIGLTQIRGRFFTGSVPGHVILALGILFLLGEFNVVDRPLRIFFPLVLVFIGTRLVFGPRLALVIRKREPVDIAASVDHFAFFSGVVRKINSQEFVGGNLGAFCGGWDIDLREAGLAGEEAVIDLFAWWGGGDIRVPTDWEIVVQAQPLFGGVSVKAQSPAPLPGARPKRLILTGMLIMGGVEVKN